LVSPNFQKLWNVELFSKTDDNKRIEIVLMIFEAINNKLTDLRRTLVFVGKLEQVAEVRERISGKVTGASTNDLI